jgi:3-dehydroquinate synthase
MPAEASGDALPDPSGDADASGDTADASGDAVETLLVAVPETPARSYEVRIRPGGLEDLGEVCAAAAPAHRYAVVADSHVAELYGRRALNSLAKAGLAADMFTFPAGEWNKSREQWAELSDALLGAGFGRDGAVVALGGGVTGDLAGFLASSFMRGVAVVQVPTTLLAMVDSSVGGKTGVDASAAKNAIGAFHHPRAVLIDPSLLDTLPPYQRVTGLAEAVKAAAVRDAALFEWIGGRAADLERGELEATAELILRSVRIKAGVVAEDPEETGLRAILNFGHTVGHALETLSGYAVLHGEAVAAGMRVEAWLGEEIGVTESGTGARLDEVLNGCGLPEVLEQDHTAERLLEAARPDKKAREGALRWVLLRRVGEVAGDSRGGFTRPLRAEECLEPLAAALRTAAKAANSAM